eukprot:m.230362 g.230362  ORF g.230362 m.230362 type:complete len:72 (-) comp19257_c0_seq4:1861-2076(-)
MYPFYQLHGRQLHRRLMENMSGTERLRAAVRAGNTTALVELCLHLQEQVNSLNTSVTKIVGTVPHYHDTAP